MEIVGPWLSPVRSRFQEKRLLVAQVWLHCQQLGPEHWGYGMPWRAGSMAARWVGRSWQKFQWEEDLEIQILLQPKE